MLTLVSAHAGSRDAALVEVERLVPLYDSLKRVRSAVELAAPQRLLRPDDLEHEPLVLIELDPADISAVGEALVELRRVVLETGYRVGEDEQLTKYLEAHYRGKGIDTSTVLELLARFHGVLDLDHGHDQDLIEPAVRRSLHSLVPVVLDDDREDALDRMGSRWLVMWRDRYQD